MSIGRPARFPATLTRPRVADADTAWRMLSELHKAEQEHFIVFDLDTRLRLIAKRVVFVGSLSGVEVHPREVFRGAIQNGAAKIIIAHNHPSGDVTPSRMDFDLTARLKEVGTMVGIPILDHIVFAAGGYLSLSERGWL